MPRSDVISLDELAKYSHWPQRLLGLEQFAVRHKTEAEVLREFRDDKWGTLLKQVRSLKAPTLDQVERLHVDFEMTSSCYDEGVFYLTNEGEMLNRHLDLYSSVMRPHVAGASALVELGAGFGSKILALSDREEFQHCPLVAAEFTNTGRELIDILAKAGGKQVAVGRCDFRHLEIEGVAIPENALIYTSSSVHYVPELDAGFIDFMSALRPKAVVHFEPCYEYHPTDSLFGLMCRRYIELNDYNRNLASRIETAHAQGRISLNVRRNVLGSNPFLPFSVVEWAPAK